jgi:hypothetical protein
MNVEKLIDIQPDGDANFCVDFPDYCNGNMKESSIRDIRNSPGAARCISVMSNHLPGIAAIAIGITRSLDPVDKPQDDRKNGIAIILAIEIAIEPGIGVAIAIDFAFGPVLVPSRFR